MSKAMQPKKPALTSEEANEQVHSLVTSGTSTASWEELWDIVESADDSTMKVLSGDYFKFEEHGKYVFLITGVIDTDIKGKRVRVVTMQDREKNTLINGDKMLVSACDKLDTIPCFVTVDYIGEKRTAQGEYKELVVKTFRKPSGEVPF